MRASSPTSPAPVSGTLKSTRRNTRRPVRSTSSMVRLGNDGRPWVLQGLAHVEDEVADPARVAPLVVVPGEDLDQVALDERGRGAVHDRRVRVAVEVRRDQLLVGEGQDVL